MGFYFPGNLWWRRGIVLTYMSTYEMFITTRRLVKEICYLKAFFGNWYSLLYVGMRVIESSKVKNCVLRWPTRRNAEEITKFKMLEKLSYYNSLFTSLLYIQHLEYIFVGVLFWVFFKTATNKQHCVYSYKHIN